ncbi:MAG: 2Fe-2S iron-sulfur cluster-binding protein [Hyphomonas sp.]
MVGIKFITPSGDVIEVAASVGENLMELAVKHDVQGMVAACGGCLACATCHVYVDDQSLKQLESQSDAETEMLEYASHVESGLRLSCQISVRSSMEGAIIRMSPSQD